MNHIHRPLSCLLTAIATILFAGTNAAAQTPAAAPPAPVTAVLVSLTIKPGADRAAVAATMPAEVRDTVLAYLDGKITQWFARADGTGVVFLVEATSTEGARAIMDTLPLAKAGLADFAFTPLTPLTPLRRLLTAPGAKE